MSVRSGAFPRISKTFWATDAQFFGGCFLIPDEETVKHDFHSVVPHFVMDAIGRKLVH